MPIQLTTGIPGAGKTQLVIAQALTMVGCTDHSSVEVIREQLANKRTRPLYVCGIEGWKLGDLVPEITDPLTWRDLPEGSVIVVDEGWKWFGDHLVAISRDTRYLSLAEHRHAGYDFIVTGQAPTQFHKGIKALAGPYEHVSRKFGSKTTVVWTWPTVQGSPDSDAAKNRALDRVWSYNPVIQDLYESATIHTIKRKFPRKVILALLVLPLVAILAVFAGKAALSIGKKGTVPGIGDAAASAGESAPLDGSRSKQAPLTTEEWVKQFIPRVRHLPMSAPAFDEREITSEPRVYCVLAGAGTDALGDHLGDSCTCLTEQGTAWELGDAMCRGVVATGGAYDYFKKPPLERREQRRETLAIGPVSPETVPAMQDVRERARIDALVIRGHQDAAGEAPAAPVGE